MNAVQKAVARADRVQQGHPWLAFPVAVWKKFGDDQAGNLAALIAYYAFASLFPLLLVLVTVLDIVLAHNPGLRDRLLNSAFSQIPVIGTEMLQHPQSMTATGPALVIGIILTLYGARGVASAAQNALNKVWGVPIARRPGFPWAMLRDFGLIAVVGLGVTITTTLSGLAGRSPVLPGTGGQIVAVAVSLILNVGVFWLAFRLATAKEIGMREMLPSAALAAVVWQILQLLGTYLVHRYITRSSAAYGVFAVVIGLMAWMYLAAQFTLYAVEINVVAARRLWPRSLAPPPLTEPDREAYGMYARREERRPEQEIESRIIEPRASQAQTPASQAQTPASQAQTPASQAQTSRAQAPNGQAPGPNGQA